MMLAFTNTRAPCSVVVCCVVCIAWEHNTWCFWSPLLGTLLRHACATATTTPRHARSKVKVLVEVVDDIQVVIISGASEAKVLLCPPLEVASGSRVHHRARA